MGGGGKRCSAKQFEKRLIQLSSVECGGRSWCGSDNQRMSFAAKKERRLPGMGATARTQGGGWCDRPN